MYRAAVGWLLYGKQKPEKLPFALLSKQNENGIKAIIQINQRISGKIKFKLNLRTNCICLMADVIMWFHVL